MWKSRTRDNGPIHRRSLSGVNFTHTSFKDVEHLFSNDNDDVTSFKNLTDQPPPMTSSSTTAVKRLSVFHRVHMATRFARAFAKPASESRAAVDEKSTKSQISEKSEKSRDEKATKNERRMTVSGAEFSKMSIESRVGVEKRVESHANRLITIPGAEKRVVIYTTSLRVVRPTFEACKTVNSILRGFRVSIDERDLSMDSNYLSELQSIMAENNEECEKNNNNKKMNLTLPKVFIGGRYIGGAEEVKTLHESGELKKYIEELPSVKNGVCELCGDFRFVLCDECRGSHKCYSEKSGFRSCSLCNENGLIRCLACFDS